MTNRVSRPAAAALKTEGASAYRALLGEGGLAEKIQKTAWDRLEIIPSELDIPHSSCTTANAR